MSEKISRRRYLKYVGAGIVGVAVAGAGAYYATMPSPTTPEPTTTAVTSAQTPTTTAVTSAQTPVGYKVALLLPSPVGDFGWNYAAYNAMKQVSEEIPGMELAWSDHIAEVDAEPYLRDYLRLGNKVIFAHSWGYQDACFKLAKDYPDVAFLYPGGGPSAVGVATYYARDYEAQYLAGMVAGLMTKSNVIGFVGSYPIETLVYGINAFIQGAKDVNPKVKERVAFVGSWYDPPKEKETAYALMDSGVDFFSHYMDSAAVLEAAQERGAHCFGMYTDSRFIAPKAVAGIVVWNWAPFFKEIVTGWKNGTISREDLNQFYYRGIAEGMCDLTFFGPMVPQDVLDKIDQKRKQIVSGEFKVPAIKELTWEK